MRLRMQLEPHPSQSFSLRESGRGVNLAQASRLIPCDFPVDLTPRRQDPSKCKAHLEFKATIRGRLRQAGSDRRGIAGS
jgi:hypothetical protein